MHKTTDTDRLLKTHVLVCRTRNTIQQRYSNFFCSQHV